MILTLCMAGFNSRFHDAGFDVPKYLLPWDGDVIIGGILRELQPRELFSRVVLLPNRRDEYFRKDLVASVAPFGVAESDILYIADTQGQAHTAAIGSQFVLSSSGGANGPIAFHNADTILTGRNWPWVAQQLETRDVFVDVFPASSPNYSYVSLHEGRVAAIREKLVISPFASSGFYGFRTAESFLQSFQTHADQNAGRIGETYISDVIQSMIEAGADVFINELSGETRTTVLGKPEEYGLELARRALGR